MLSVCFSKVLFETSDKTFMDFIITINEADLKYKYIFWSQSDNDKEKRQ